MRRLLIVLAVLVACMAPTAAYAQDVSLIDSFTSGVGTWGGGQEEKLDSNSSEEVVGNSGLFAAPAEGAEGETSTVQHVNNTLDAFNTVTFNFGERTLLQGAIVMFGNTSYSWNEMYILPAIGMVFLWWGVRKGVRVLMAAWRKGHASV